MITHRSGERIVDQGDKLAPVPAFERIETLDVLRGFALLGIFLMNVEFFNQPLQDIAGEGVDPNLRGVHYAADWLVYFFVQGKFWTLFSLLFGMGFAVMIERAQRARRPFLPVYLRRSAALLGIGLVHALLVWSGDILVTYAIGALVMVLARQVRRMWQSSQEGMAPEAVAGMSAMRLAGWGLLLYCLIPVAVMLAGVARTAMPDATAPTAAELQETATERARAATNRAAALHAYRDGDYAQAVTQRVVDTREELGDMVAFLPMLLGIFLLGAALVRSGVAARPQDFLPQLRSARNLGLPLGFGLMAASTGLGTTGEPEQFDLRWAMQVATYLLAGLVLALAYAATLTLALRGPAGAWLRRWLAPAGRMALTNYLGQSVLGTLFFYGYGLGYWGLPRAWQVVFVLAVFAMQALLSRWWLARFRHGPVEWLWRGATYLKLPPLRAAAGA